MKWNMLCTSINFNFKYHEIYIKTSFRTLRSLTFIKMWRVLISPVNSLQMARNLKAFLLSQFKLRLKKPSLVENWKTSQYRPLLARARSTGRIQAKEWTCYAYYKFFFFQISPIILALRKCFIDRCTSEYCVSNTRDVTMVSVVWITTAILELISLITEKLGALHEST